MTATRWAILGPGAISRDFVAALGGTSDGIVHAVGSSDPARARDAARAFGAEVSGTYEEVLARTDLDAVYIGTVHTTHVELARRALEAGHPVLCEKPMSLDAAGARELVETSRRRDVPLVEAYKYRFAPHFQRVRDLAAAGAIGQVLRIEASNGFDAGTRTGRLFDPTVGGGAILDVGCYPVSYAVGIAAACGADLSAARVTQVRAARAYGVDVRADAVLELGGISAHVSTAVTAARTRRIRILGSTGSITLPEGWGSRTRSAELVRLRRGRSTEELRIPVLGPMTAEAEALVAARRAGRIEDPAIPHAESVRIARLLESWRAQTLAAA